MTKLRKEFRQVRLQATRPGALRDAGDRTLADNHYLRVSPGRQCRTCTTTEAGCARHYPCCTTCTHLFGEGEEPRPPVNPNPEPVPVHMVCKDCGIPYERKTKPRKWCAACGGELVAA